MTAEDHARALLLDVLNLRNPTPNLVDQVAAHLKSHAAEAMISLGLRIIADKSENPADGDYNKGLDAALGIVNTCIDHLRAPAK